jgi:hypothetical protein
MLGGRAGVVVELRRYYVHGVAHIEVVVELDDGGRHAARLGAESVPVDLEPGDRVTARFVMSSIVALDPAAG